MHTLATTSLSDQEKELLRGFVASLRARLDGALHAVWLYGSRARGEPRAHEDSDVDVLVLINDESWEAKQQVHRVFADVAGELGLESLSPWFSIHVHTPGWLDQRRAVKSFFVADIDRDKVVVDEMP